MPKEKKQETSWKPRAFLGVLQKESHMMLLMLDFINSIKIEDKKDAQDFYKLLYFVANFDSSETNDIFDGIIRKMSFERGGVLTSFGKQFGKGTILEKLQDSLEKKPIRLHEIRESLKGIRVEDKNEITSNEIEKIKEVVKEALKKADESEGNSEKTTDHKSKNFK